MSCSNCDATVLWFCVLSLHALPTVNGHRIEHGEAQKNPLRLRCAGFGLKRRRLLAPEGIEQFYLSRMNACFCRFGFDFFPRMFPRFILPIPWAKGTRTGDGQCGFFSGRFESLG